MTQQILEYPSPRRPSQLCSIVYLRYALFGFTTVLLLSAICLLGFGVYSLIEEIHIAALLPILYRVSVYGLVAVGALVLLAAVIGCYGTTQEQYKSLIIYSVLLVIIFISELAVGIVSYYVYTLHTSPDASLSSHLSQLITHQWGQDELITVSIDQLQSKYQCCGVSYHTDWLDNPLILNSGMKAPDSCCISSVPDCGKSDHVSNLHQKGCVEVVMDDIHFITIIIPAITLGFSIMQIIGVIFSCALARQTCRSKRIMKQRTFRY